MWWPGWCSARRGCTSRWRILPGPGASVPLLGFGHLLAQGVRQAVDACGLPGIFTGGLTAASGGIAASLLFALGAALVSKSRDQN